MGLSRRNVFLCNDDYEWFQKHAKTLDERNAAFCIREAMRDYRKKHEKKKPAKKEVKIIEHAIGYLDCTNGQYPVLQSDIDVWQTAYPAVDIGFELNKIQAWLHSNPSKRKTVKGCKRFINLWLEKSQNNGGSNGLQKQNATGYQNGRSTDPMAGVNAAIERREQQRNNQRNEQAGLALENGGGIIPHEMD